jgi:hypothetical protein
VTLLLHEVHEVAGPREQEFEAAFRDEWLGAVGRDDDARLLYFLHHAHGTGVSYNVVTVTALRDAAAWERLVRRVDGGDLAGAAQRLDGLRHDVRAKLLVPLPWSPLREIDLASVPARPADHEPTVFMEDTVWPYEGSLEQYVQRSGDHYAREMQQHAQQGESILEVLASYRTAFGSGRRREVVLWQKVVRPKALAPLIAREVPGRYKQPGTWMHDALGLRDRWESKLLRSARWSPWS